MNREDIIRMVQEAGFLPQANPAMPQLLERFAALVASAEREACAGLRKEVMLQGKKSADYEDGFWDALEKYEHLIRARGKT